MPVAAVATRVGVEADRAGLLKLLLVGTGLLTGRMPPLPDTRAALRPQRALHNTALTRSPTHCATLHDTAFPACIVCSPFVPWTM